CESHHVVSLAAIQQHLSGSQRVQIQQWQDERALLQNELAELDSAQQRTVYTCVGKDPQPSRFLPRGNVSAPGKTVAPSGLLAIQGIDPKFGLPPNATDAERRQALANWVTDANNPLFARVIVNRLWHAHFGKGLVATPSDFGFNGGQPTHPELLDWLASQLQDNGFRLKELHRLMVTSATYRQSSTLRADAAQIDADNRWLWRMTPRRLTAEEIRDAALLFGKRLDRRVGEIGYRDVRHFEFKGSNFYESIEEPDQLLRRTVYRFTPRGGRNPFLDTFDCPDPSVTTPLRATTTTPLQALALMNNPLVFQLADAFAERVALEANQTSHQIDRIYHIAYGRAVSNEETETAHTFVEQFGLSAFCRIVLNSNEFLYVR
ncbi:MAG: DUF1553 domain-containing protein, partial [Planctomycetales bacterium]|nr:DUF1553 domain-containing protein [Planctomycetales bacterium]